jgi:hypothetical protein
MIKEIIHDLSDYIVAYEKYKDSLEHKSSMSILTKVYNDLLGIAEKNADDYDQFKKTCLKKNIFGRFNKATKKCRKEFEKHI